MSDKETKKTTEQTSATAPAAAKAPVKTVAAAAAPKHENIMYVGPSIPGVAIQNTVYTEIPAGALEAIKGRPIIRNLFVPIKDYSKAEEMIRTQSGHIYAAFEAAAKYREERRVINNG